MKEVVLGRVPVAPTAVHIVGDTQETPFSAEPGELAVVTSDHRPLRNVATYVESGVEEPPWLMEPTATQWDRFGHEIP